MRIALTGASGSIGSALVPALRADGHSVLRLVRRAPRASDEAGWDPARGRLDPSVLAGVDAVVNLSGAGVGDRRWTAGYRRVLERSRVDSTATLCAAIAAAEPRPRTLLSASAVGWYGDTGDRPVDEGAGPGTGFLAALCRQWEDATAAADQAGVRVVHLRSGLVLGRGGLLSRMVPLYRLGLGGRLGSGRQYWSWISLADEVRAITFLLANEAVSGPVNVTGPAPVTNAEFSRALARAVHRPAVLPVPAVALRVALGVFADEGVLVSQRVLPRVLEQAGFRFDHPTVDAALRYATGRGGGG